VAVAEAGAAATAVLAGIAATDRAIDAGATLLVPRVGARDDVSARAVVGLLTRKEASAVVAQSPGMTDREWMTVCAAVRDRMATASHLRGEPLALLDALGAGHLAGVVGVLLGASARRTPCLVDGTDELAAALVADRLSYTRAKGWWRAGSDSPDPGRHAAMDRIDITPGLPLGLSDDAGRGAQVTVAVLRMLTSDGASA
jgi:NaMN:DMB phosphoribosyltransferase